MTNLYYSPYIDTEGEIQEHALYDLMYPLDPLTPPHNNTKSIINKCPAITAYNNQSAVLRAPVEINLMWDTFKSEWKYHGVIANKDFVIKTEDNSPIIQLKFYYLFWQDKPSNTQLFLYDPPLHQLNRLPNFYTTSGMIPIGQYTRNTSIGLVIKNKDKPIKINRGDALATITAVSDKKIKFIRKDPPKHILQTNYRHLMYKHLCPYTLSTKLFSRWL